MDISRGITVKSAGYQLPAIGAFSSSSVYAGQREAKLQAFRKKYDAMLNFVEFMASLSLLLARNSEAVRQVGELKSLLTQTRSQLQGMTFNECVRQDKADRREH